MSFLFDLFDGFWLRLKNTFFDEDLEEGHLSADFVSQGSPLIVIRHHLNVSDDLVETDTFTCHLRHFVNMDKVCVQMIESRLVVEVRQDFAALYVEFFLDRI